MDTEKYFIRSGTMTKVEVNNSLVQAINNRITHFEVENSIKTKPISK